MYNQIFENYLDFDSAIFFDFYKYSDSYNVKKFAKCLTEQFLSYFPKQKKNKNKINQYFAQIMCNLIIAYEIKKCVIISRDRNYYSTNTLIKPQLFISLIDWLTEKKYINQKIGFFNRDINKGQRTRIWANKQLVDFFNQFQITSEQIKTREKYSQIILKDENKKEIKFMETDQLKTLRDRIHKINNLYLQHSFELGGVHLFPRISAIYNNSSFDCCGRLYNKSKQGLNYQLFSSEERKNLKIDGEETIELDYSALHITMLYHMQGVDLTFDPYSFYQDRKQAKKVLYRIFNSDNIGRMLYGLNQEDTQVDWLNVITRAKQMHQKIAKYFGSGIGTKLMNIDSKIMLDILEYFTDKQIVALGMHDSVIIPKKHYEELKKVMKETYKKHMGKDIQVK